MTIKKLAQNIQRNQLIKSFGIYTLAKIINSCIPFFLLPVMTSYLTPSDYGVISMITTVAAFMLPFVSLNTDTFLVRKYYNFKDKIAEYTGTCVTLVIISCIITTILSIIFSKDLSLATHIPRFIIYLIPTYCVFVFLKTVVMYSWQVRSQPIKFGVFSIIFSIVEISIALITIIGLGMNWMGRAISLFTATFFAALFAIIYLKKKKLIVAYYNNQQAVAAIKFGSGLIPHALGVSLMVLANRFFITDMVNISETGLYSVASQIASVLSFITLSFNNAYVPWLFEKLSLKSSETNKKIVKLTYGYFFSIFIIVIIIYFGIVLIFPFIVGEKFDGSLKYLPFLLLGNALQGCYFMVTNYILYSEKTYYNGIITTVVGVISILLNYVFIKHYGGVGATVAYAVTYFIYFISTWYIANKAYKMPWFRISNKV